MINKKIILLALLSAFYMSACDEGLGVNVTLKSKDKSSGSSQAVSLDIDGKDVKVGTAASDVTHLEDGRKVTVSSQDSVMVSPAETKYAIQDKYTTMPPTFFGTWAAITKNEAHARGVCVGSYDDQDSAWVREITEKKVKDILFYEDVDIFKPQSYRVAARDRVMGRGIEEVFELGVDNPVETITKDFEYQLENGRLYVTEIDLDGKQAGKKTSMSFLRCE